MHCALANAPAWNAGAMHCYLETTIVYGVHGDRPIVEASTGSSSAMAAGASGCRGLVVRRAGNECDHDGGARPAAAFPGTQPGADQRRRYTAHPEQSAR